MDIYDDDIWESMGWNKAWECFNGFLERYFPFDSQKLTAMPDVCRNAVIAHLYETEVTGDGHGTFLEMYGDFITSDMPAKALENMNAPHKVMEVIRKFGDIPPDNYEALESLDREFYSLPPDIIPEIIAEYVKNHIEHFKT